MTVNTDMSTTGLRGWALKEDRPEMFPGAQYERKRRRLAAGMKAATVIRRLIELAAHQGVRVATPASQQTMLSRWENGKDEPSIAYERLLCRIYGIRRPEDRQTLPARYRNNAIYDRLLHAPRVGLSPLTQPGLR
jgi:transcriptional regulator with XRE-family HTH domain